MGLKGWQHDAAGKNAVNNPENVSSKPESHVVGGKNNHCRLSSDPHMHPTAHVDTDTQ